MLEDLKTFCGRINARLEDAIFEEKQAILQLLIERIIVGEDILEIRHVIPLDGPPRGSCGSAAPPESGLRSDGVNPAPLPAGSYQHSLNGALQTPVSVAGYEPPPQSPRATKERKKAPREKAPSSLGPTSKPKTSLSPVSPFTPTAMTTAVEATCPSWRHLK